MSFLDLKKVLKLITANQINYRLYTYNHDKNIDDSILKCIDISKELLFCIILKITLPRDYNNIISFDITSENKNKALEHELEDSDSLFVVNVNFNKNYIFYNGSKIYNGHCVVSKNEVMQLYIDDKANIEFIKKIYYPITTDMDEYINIMDKALSIIELDIVNDRDDNIVLLIENFVTETIIHGRLYVADLIIRDYYNLLKHEIDRLENTGYKIYRVDDTKIFYT